MQGYNKAFIKDVRAFLEKHPLRITAKDVYKQGMFGLKTDVFGVGEFDIRPCGSGVELVPFKEHEKTHKWGKQRVLTGYWVDYKEGAMNVISLAPRRADFVFTPMLTGCYIAIGAQRVAHIAGDLSKQGGSADFQKLAEQSKGLHSKVEIGFNSNPPPQFGSESEQAPAREYTFVGAFANGAWKWYVQCHTLFSDSGATLCSVWPLSGPSVIELVDRTYG